MCALECPFSIFPEGSLFIGDKIFRVLVPFSFIGSMYVSLSIYCDKKRLSNQIQKYLLHFNASVLLFYLPLFILLFAGEGDPSDTGVYANTCKNNSELLQGSDSFGCLMTGALSVFSMYAAIFWWSVYNFDVFIKVMK